MYFYWIAKRDSMATEGNPALYVLVILIADYD